MKDQSIAKQKGAIHSRIAPPEKCWHSGFSTGSGTIRRHVPRVAQCPSPTVEPAGSHNTPAKTVPGILDRAADSFDAHSTAQRFNPNHFWASGPKFFIPYKYPLRAAGLKILCYKNTLLFTKLNPMKESSSCTKSTLPKEVRKHIDARLIMKNGVALWHR